MGIFVGIDIGGTFTDLVIVDTDTQTPITGKLLTSYPDPVISVRELVNDAKVSLGSVDRLFHGTTIGINAIVEGTAPPAALITTRGFRDILEMRRGSRSETWDLRWKPLPPLIERPLRFEVDERTGGSGETLSPVDPKDVEQIVTYCRDHRIMAVAICFINSYINPDNEILARSILNEIDPDLYVSISSELSREMGEYERTSTVAVNAMLQPVMSSYLRELGRFFSSRGLSTPPYVMQSTGGVTTFADGSRLPALVVESGPAAGVVGTAEVARACGISNAISFDMGGTTAKACVVLDGVPQVSPSYRIGGGKGYVVQVAGVDIVEIGAGGGSIAYVDAAGALRVGPRSAGSSPGPACYGLGGVEPTITDANLVLGRFAPVTVAGGTITLNQAAAEAAIKSAASRLGLSIVDLAAGILEIANVMMAGAVRRVTAERGLDPRDFVLVAYGGAGPLHACDIARQLHIPSVVIPPYPGHFSALGMLVSKVRRDYARTFLKRLDSDDSIPELQAVFEDMRSEATTGFVEIGGNIEFSYAADMRYVGQHHTVTVRLPPPLTVHGIEAVFRDVFARQFAHEYLEGALEIVTARLTAVAPDTGIDVRYVLRASSQKDEPPRVRSVFFGGEGFVECPVWQRRRLPADAVIHGPALVEEEASTTVLGAGDRLTLNDIGCLVVDVQSSGGVGGSL